MNILSASLLAVLLAAFSSAGVASPAKSPKKAAPVYRDGLKFDLAACDKDRIATVHAVKRKHKIRNGPAVWEYRVRLQDGTKKSAQVYLDASSDPTERLGQKACLAS